jgi:hypothetical protein
MVNTMQAISTVMDITIAAIVPEVMLGRLGVLGSYGGLELAVGFAHFTDEVASIGGYETVFKDVLDGPGADCSRMSHEYKSSRVCAVEPGWFSQEFFTASLIGSQLNLVLNDKTWNSELSGRLAGSGKVGLRVMLCMLLVFRMRVYGIDVTHFSKCPLNHVPRPAH